MSDTINGKICSVLLADDHDIVRAGLRNIIRDAPELHVVAEAQNGREAIALVEKFSPDVVVMDIAMPELNGIEATYAILERRPKTHILCLSMYEDRRYVVRMLKNGAQGYILKDSAVDELIDAINAVRKGRIYVSAQLTPYITDALGDVGNMISIDELLTPREREFLQLLAEGYSTKDISEKCILSPRTVDTHRKSIMEKLNVHSIAELTRTAIREGLIKP
jgi:DNA-binding NarL/FixJ family response regulator